jgi:hypothetical protein
MGKFGTTDNVVQELTNALGGGSYDTPAYFNGQIYYSPVGNAKTFAISNGQINPTPTSKSKASYGFAGTIPTISANGTSNTIVWMLDRGGYELHAYSASGFNTELYNSGQAPRPARRHRPAHEVRGRHRGQRPGLLRHGE